MFDIYTEKNVDFTIYLLAARGSVYNRKKSSDIVSYKLIKHFITA